MWGCISIDVVLVQIQQTRFRVFSYVDLCMVSLSKLQELVMDREACLRGCNEWGTTEQLN